MDYGFLSLVPILVLIIGVVVTKRMLEMLFISSILASIIMYRGGFFIGYRDMMYATIQNDTYELILIILLGVGALIELFQASGAMNGFGKAVSGFANTPKKASLTAWIMGVIMFFDDYMNTLSVVFSMRGITDKNNVPREHLAYTACSMGASLCVLVPFTSWSAFAMATASDYGVTFGSYMKSIPFMFLPILAVICALLVTLGIIPKVGNVKKGYERIAAGGSVYYPGDKHAGEDEGKEEAPAIHPINFFLPLVVLVGVMIAMDNTMEYGIIAALVLQFVMYVGQKVMTIKEFLENMINGFLGFVELAFTIFLAYMTASTCLEMGMADFIISHVVKSVPGWALPAMIFVVVGLIGCTADSWVVTVLTVPVFLPMSEAAGIGVVLPMAAIMSGVVLATKVCLFADDVFMISGGTGLDNAAILKTAAPYIVSCAVLSAGIYLGVGYMMFH